MNIKIEFDTKQVHISGGIPIADVMRLIMDTDEEHFEQYVLHPSDGHSYAYSEDKQTTTT